MLYGLLVLIYVVVCLFLIGTVLLQTGKRADLAGAFGGGGSQTAFGVRGAANALTRATTASAVGFMLLALTLSILSRSQATGSVLDDVQPTPPAQSGAAVPGPDTGSESVPAGSDPIDGAGDSGDVAPAETDADTQTGDTGDTTDDPPVDP